MLRSEFSNSRKSPVEDQVWMVTEYPCCLYKSRMLVSCRMVSYENRLKRTLCVLRTGDMLESGATPYPAYLPPYLSPPFKSLCRFSQALWHNSFLRRAAMRRRALRWLIRLRRTRREGGGGGRVLLLLLILPLKAAQMS